jgi:hypothetical protein
MLSWIVRRSGDDRAGLLIALLILRCSLRIRRLLGVEGFSGFGGER